MYLNDPAQRGIGLMEILITLLVLSIGLLGAAQLQLLSLNDAQSSKARINATLLAYDLADRIRANSTLFELPGETNYYLKVTAAKGVQAPAPDAPSCTNGCLPAEQAAKDVREWLENLVDVAGVAADGDAYQPLLSNATAHLSQAADDTLTLTLSWEEADRGSKKVVTQNYTQEIKL